MKTKVYISEQERKKCKKVVTAFKELYDMEDLIVFDAGGYGFIKVQYYKYPYRAGGYSKTFLS